MSIQLMTRKVPPCWSVRWSPEAQASSLTVGEYLFGRGSGGTHRIGPDPGRPKVPGWWIWIVFSGWLSMRHPTNAHTLPWLEVELSFGRYRYSPAVSPSPTCACHSEPAQGFGIRLIPATRLAFQRHRQEIGSASPNEADGRPSSPCVLRPGLPSVRHICFLWEHCLDWHHAGQHGRFVPRVAGLAACA